jgi:GntR family transcriptional repressor for pyruvate dehydrogenase complex
MPTVDRSERKAGVVVLLQPVEKQTLAKVVMQRLVEYIQGSNLQPGDALPSQHELAVQLSVSRPVLREAMQGLASIGLIEIRPGSGCYVRDQRPQDDSDNLFEVLTHESALELYEARMVVEVELAGMAAERATEADLQQMQAILARIKRTVARGQPSTQITFAFHQALNRAGHNSYLFRMLHLFSKARLSQGVRVETTFPDVTTGEYDSHKILYEAVYSRDAARARQAYREHLELAHRWEDAVAALHRQIAAESLQPES